MAAILMILFLGFWVVLYLIYLKVFYSPHKDQGDVRKISESEQYSPYREKMLDLINDLDARPYEEVYITSHDGLRLFGRYYHFNDGAPLDIGFHGYRGCALRDMCGGVHISYQLGHNILLIDERAHGRSEGQTITFGINERLDCLSWIEYAKRRFGDDVRIVLYGVSMGAATVLMASEFDIGKNVCCILADCPYSSPEKIIKKVSHDMNLPANLVYPLIRLSANVFGRFKLSETTAEDAVKKSKVPIIIFHGEDDRFVPREMSEVVQKANPDIERYTFPKAAHAISGIVDTERYNQLAMDFIKKHCPW